MSLFVFILIIIEGLVRVVILALFNRLRNLTAMMRVDGTCHAALLLFYVSWIILYFMD